MRPRYKICPVCGTRAELDARACFTCGHQFRTQFGGQAPADPSQPPQDAPHLNPPQQGAFGQPQSRPQGSQQGHGAFSQNPQQGQPLPPGFQDPPQYGALPSSYGPNPPGYGAFGQGPPGGVAGQISVPPGSINPLLHCLVCIVAPGVGQCLNKQVSKGCSLILGTIASCFLCPLVPLLVVPVACWDAYAIGKKLNEGRAVGQWEWF